MGKVFAFLTGGWIGPLLISGGLVVTLWAGYAYITHTARAEGRAEVQAAWDKDIQARALLAAGAAENKRVKEAQDAEKFDKERADRERDGIVVGTVLAAYSARDNSVRNAAASAARALQACNIQSANPGADGPAETFRRVFEECRGELRTMGTDAEGLATQVRGLQARVGSALSVCGE